MNEKMPKVVKVALALCLLTILITTVGPMIHESVFIKRFLEYASGLDHRGVVLFQPCTKIALTLVGSFFGLVLFCALAYGKSWARKTYIVMFVLTASSMACSALIAKLPFATSQFEQFQWWNLANLAIDAVVVALLYFRTTRTWFKGDAIPENKWKNRFQCLLYWFLLLSMQITVGFVLGIATGIEQCGKWHDKYPHIRVAQLKALANQGDAPSMWRLGNWERNGWLGEKHPDKAIVWYQKASDLGDRHALNDLGDCYEKGIGTEPNIVKAIECWTKAAEKKHGWAACKVAIRHQKDKKTDEAFTWFRKAAELGNDYGCCKFGECYEHGWGTETNAVEAARWFIKGAERRHAWGMEKAGDFYAAGYGVEKDLAKAREWYEKAVKRNNSKSAAKKLETLKEETNVN